MIISKRMTSMLTTIILTLFLFSCTGNNAYRHKYLIPSDDSNITECSRFSPMLDQYGKNQGDYSLGFVEVDEQGVFFSRDQFNNLSCELAHYAQSEEGVLISVFVHGWHHNAKLDDQNLINFQESLKSLSVLEHIFAKEKGIQPRKTVGIFIGWRGESINWEPFSYLTFWERKQVAEEIAKRSILEALLRLETIRNMPSKNKQSNRLFVLGHSFGADVVFNALSPIMLERLINNKTQCKDKPIQGFGDFVFLINPAFESLQYINFSSLLSEKSAYCENQFPVFAILTSEKDIATKHFFPFGRFFSTFFETYRDIDILRENGDTIKVKQHDLDTTAIGHEKIFFTHHLQRNENYKSKVAVEENGNECVLVSDFRNGWITNKQHYVLGDVILINTEQYHAKNPYLVIKVDKKIIPDHNRIYADQVLNFMRRLVVISTHEEICSGI